MAYPRLNFISAKRDGIYIRNIIRWAACSPEIATNYASIEVSALLEQIDTITERFALEFSTVSDSVFEFIEKMTGWGWNRHQPVIEVYPIPFFNSFSHPLFLKVCSVRLGKINPRTNGEMLGLLVHELCHQNLSSFDQPHDQLEAVVEHITIRILDSIAPDSAHEYASFRDRLRINVKKDLVPDCILEGVSVRTHFMDPDHLCNN